MKAAPRKKVRIIRCMAWVLTIPVVLVLGSSVVFYALARTGFAHWQQVVDEIHGKGEPLTFAEIEATRPKIPDASSGAAAIHQAIQLLDGVTDSNKTGVFLLDTTCEADFIAGIERRCVPPSRNYLDARRQGLAKLAELMRFAQARLNLSYEGTMFDTSGPILNTATQYRTLGRLLSVDAILKTIDGDTAGAVDALSLQLRLSEPLYAEPDVLLNTVGLANDARAIKTIEGLLSVHELQDDELARLERAWKRHLAYQSVRSSLLGQRAWLVRVTDRAQGIAARSETITVADGDGWPENGWHVPNPVDWIPFKNDWFMVANRVQGVAVLTRLVDALDDPYQLLKTARHEQATLSHVSTGTIFLRITLPSVVHWIELHNRAVARSQCLFAALESERFRRAKDRFPEHLNELIPNYLTEVPRDPFVADNRIRLFNNRGDLVIYSVGENETDDGGRITPENRARHGLDVGVRLMDPAKRSLRFKNETKTPHEYTAPSQSQHDE